MSEENNEEISIESEKIKEQDIGKTQLLEQASSLGIFVEGKSDEEILNEIKEISHPKWRFGETIKEKCEKSKSKAKMKKNIDDIIEWLEALEERIEFLEARL